MAPSTVRLYRLWLSDAKTAMRSNYPLGDRQRQALQAVEEAPGLTRIDYIRQLGWQKAPAYRAFSALFHRGLITLDDEGRVGLTHHPVDQQPARKPTKRLALPQRWELGMWGNILEQTAIHEAGHTIIALNLGYAVEYVTIVPQADCDGHMSIPDAAFDGHLLRHTSYVYLAGRSAESKAKRGYQGPYGLLPRRTRLGAYDSADLSETAVSDLRYVESLWQYRGLDEPGPRKITWRQELNRSTNRLVNQHWSEILDLADRLLEEKTVRF